MIVLSESPGRVRGHGHGMGGAGAARGLRPEGTPMRRIWREIGQGTGARRGAIRAATGKGPHAHGSRLLAASTGASRGISVAGGPHG